MLGRRRWPRDSREGKEATAGRGTGNEDWRSIQRRVETRHRGQTVVEPLCAKGPRGMSSRCAGGVLVPCLLWDSLSPAHRQGMWVVCLKRPSEPLREGVSMAIIREEKGALGQRAQVCLVSPLGTRISPGPACHQQMRGQDGPARPALHVLPCSLGTSGSQALPAPPRVELTDRWLRARSVRTFRQHLPAGSTRWLL